MIKAGAVGITRTEAAKHSDHGDPQLNYSEHCHDT